jgi:hypothetical protein
VHAVAGESLLDLIGREFPLFGGSPAGAAGDCSGKQEKAAHDSVP